MISVRCLYLFIIPKPVNVSRCNFQEKIRKLPHNPSSLKYTNLVWYSQYIPIRYVTYKNKIVMLENCSIVRLSLWETSKNSLSISSVSSPAFVCDLHSKDSHVIVVAKYFANISTLFLQYIYIPANTLGSLILLIVLVASV